MTTLQPISFALIKSAKTMKLNIFLIFIIFVKFSSSQVVFPDAATTTTPTPTTTETMEEMTEVVETTEEPMEEATGEETTEEQVTEKTDMTTTEVIPVTKAVTICAAIHQCQNIDGRTEDDGTGKMDVRVNNVSPDFQNFWLIFN